MCHALHIAIVTCMCAFHHHQSEQCNSNQPGFQQLQHATLLEIDTGIGPIWIKKFCPLVKSFTHFWNVLSIQAPGCPDFSLFCPLSNSGPDGSVSCGHGNYPCCQVSVYPHLSLGPQDHNQLLYDSRLCFIWEQPDITGFGSDTAWSTVLPLLGANLFQGTVLQKYNLWIESLPA